MIIQSADSINKFIQAHTVEQCLSDMRQGLLVAFTEIALFEQKPRSSFYIDQGVFEDMPVLGPDYYAMKYINCHPQNINQQLPTIMGVGLLVERQTGRPLMIADMALLTAIRTAAMQALVLSQCRLQNPQNLACIGCGAQAEFLCLAMSQVMDLQQVTLFDIDTYAAMRCAQHLSERGIVVEVATSADMCASHADVLITSTCSYQRQCLMTELPKRCQFIAAVGGDAPGKTEFSADIVEKCQVVTEYIDQALIEGEIQGRKDLDVRDVHSIISQNLDVRDGCIFHDSVGIALEDYVALSWLYSRCNAKDQQFCAQPADPKNLFSLVVE